MTEAIDLEVLARRPAGAARPTPLLFVHGAFASAQIWAPFFLPYFAEQGYAAYAVSVRGHGASSRPSRTNDIRLLDYVADVLGAMARLPATPVLIGHSMGGMIVQKILAERPLPAAVLMCPAPPHGLFGSALAAMFGNPRMFLELSAVQRLGAQAASLDSARRALFASDTPDDWIRRVLPPIEREPDGVMLDMTYRDLPPSRGRRDTPVLVLGAGRDACITDFAVSATAHAFGVPAEVFPDLPHGMMLVPQWQQVAERIRDWLAAALPVAATA
jgi:non-heme chloroperoxidase